MLDAKTPQPFKRLTLRRVVLLALLPAALTACMPPEDTQAAEEPAVAEPVSTEPNTARDNDAAGDTAAAHSHDHTGDTQTVADHDMSNHDMAGHDMAGHDMGGMEMAESTGALPLEAGEATVTAVPASLTDTVAYLTLRNATDNDIVLVAASSPAAEHAMLMNTVASSDGTSSMSGMIEAPSLTVPAGGELAMGSAGDHVMLMGLREPLQEGEAVPITLQADDGRTLEIEAVVQKP